MGSRSRIPKACELTRWAFGSEADVVHDVDAQSIFASHAVLVTGTILVSPLIADLASVFGVSEARAGLFIVGYTGTLLVAIPPAGVIADRVGRKTVIVPGVIVFGLAGAAIAFVDSFVAAMGLRILQAVGVAFAQPVLVAMLGDLYSGPREATAQGVRVAVDSSLSIGTPFLAGLLFVVSWRYPFLVYLLAIPAAGWLWRTLPEGETADARSLVRHVQDLMVFIQDFVVGLVMVSLIVRLVMLYGVYTYISVLAIREAGVDVVAVGILIGVLSILKLVSSTQVGRLVSLYNSAGIVFLGFVLSGIGILLMGLLPTTMILVLGMVLHGFGDGLISPAQKSLVNQLSPAEYRGGAMSAAFTCTNIGRSVGPLVLGVVVGVLGSAPMFALLGALGGGIGAGLMLGVWSIEAT